MDTKPAPNGALAIRRGKIARPQKVVAYGPEGVGKSTLASHTPEPVFLDTEGGTHHLAIVRIEAASTWEQITAAVAALAKGGHGFKTLVIDTADWLEKRLIEHLCRKHSKDSIEDFGYGKGYVVLAEEFAKFLGGIFLTSDCAEAPRARFCSSCWRRSLPHGRSSAASTPPQSDGSSNRAIRGVAPRLQPTEVRRLAESTHGHCLAHGSGASGVAFRLPPPPPVESNGCWSTSPSRSPSPASGPLFPDSFVPFGAPAPPTKTNELKRVHHANWTSSM